MGHRPAELKLLQILVERIPRSGLIFGKYTGKVRQSTYVARLASNMLGGMSTATARLSTPLLSRGRHRRYMMPFQVVSHGRGRFFLVGLLADPPLETGRCCFALCSRPIFCDQELQ